MGGAFEILSVLGEGGFSITYLGLEGSRRTRVAIKELFPLGCVRHGLEISPANHWDRESLQGHMQSVGLVEFSPDSQILLSGSNDYTARLWEAKAGIELRRYREEGAAIWSGAFSCDPDIIVTASADRKLRFYRHSTGRKIGTVDADKQHLRSVVCDPRQSIAASGEADGRIRIWWFGT